MPSLSRGTPVAGRVSLSGVWIGESVAGANPVECGQCGRQTSVTAGTIFQDTRIPLPVWFRAMWWVTTQKNGARALGLARAGVERV